MSIPTKSICLLISVSEVYNIGYLCLLEIYMTLVLEILSAITDVHHQTGLLLAYTPVLPTKTEEDPNA